MNKKYNIIILILNILSIIAYFYAFGNEDIESSILIFTECFIPVITFYLIKRKNAKIGIRIIRDVLCIISFFIILEVPLFIILNINTLNLYDILCMLIYPVSIVLFLNINLVHSIINIKVDTNYLIKIIGNIFVILVCILFTINFKTLYNEWLLNYNMTYYAYLFYALLVMILSNIKIGNKK